MVMKKTVKAVAAKGGAKNSPKAEPAKVVGKATVSKVKSVAAKVVEKVAAKVAAKKTAKPVVKETAKPVAKAIMKVAEKVASKSVVKAVAKPAPKAVAKPAKPVAKPAPKVEVKPVAKPAKPVAKPAPKAVAKPVVRSVAKTVAKPIAKPVAKSAVKFNPKADAKSAAKMVQSFDAEYLVLMQKDPNWMHAFWEVSEKRMEQARKGKGKFVLRLFDISDDLTVQRGKKRKFHDVEVPADARSWYVENTAGESCMAVLGSVDGDNFMPILESAPVLTFDKNASAPSLDDEFVRASLGGNTLGNFMSSGFSSQTAESWLNSLRLGSSSESMFSGALSSAALKVNEIAAPRDSVSYGKDFFLWVKTRLIVYGGTRPDAHLQVRGEPFPLNPDGTFSFEEDLPDSTKIIPVFATDKDGDFPTTIVPIVVKRTE